MTGRSSRHPLDPRRPTTSRRLSKQFLAGLSSAHRIALLSEIETQALDTGRLGAPAIWLEPSARRIPVADGSELVCDRPVTAIGASARPSPWQLSSGVHTLRTFADSLTIRAVLDGDGLHWPEALIGARRHIAPGAGFSEAVATVAALSGSVEAR
jgi:hypothetical protein